MACMNFDNRDVSHDDDPDPVEAYCVHCRESVEMESPVAVWTRRGMPATRGECPICGGTVFRMGRSAFHDRIAEPEKRARVKLARETVYIAFAAVDAEAAEALAADLERVGVACWLHEAEADGIAWAEGIHPALSACSRMIYLLTGIAAIDPSVEAAWRYFRSKRKPIVVAQIDAIDPPDDLRRRPRFDLTTNYKSAFRQLLQALNDGR
jgi:hypothetical protein